MDIQKKLPRLTRLALIGIGIGTVLVASPQLAQAQSSNPRAVMRELGLSRSQGRQLRSIMQGYQADLEDILTAEQFEELQDLREAQRNGQGDAISQEDIAAELELTDSQVEQLGEARESLDEELAGVLSPEQLEQLEEMAGFQSL